MSEEKKPDEIQTRYDGTSAVRQRALELLANNDELLALTIADKDASKILVKLLDGEDKQTIARQKNATDEKIAGAVTNNMPEMVEQVIRAMGGHAGIRGKADASYAPREKIDCDVKVENGELKQGEDADLSYETMVKNNAP